MPSPIKPDFRVQCYPNSKPEEIIFLHWLNENIEFNKVKVNNDGSTVKPQYEVLASSQQEI